MFAKKGAILQNLQVLEVVKMKKEDDDEKEKLIRIEIGKRIKSLIDRSTLSQVEVARKLGITPQSVQQWLSGKTSPKITQIKILADILGTTTSFIIEGCDSPFVGRIEVGEPTEVISYFGRLTIDQQKLKFKEIKEQVFENMKIFNEMNQHRMHHA